MDENTLEWTEIPLNHDLVWYSAAAAIIQDGIVFAQHDGERYQLYFTLLKWGGTCQFSKAASRMDIINFLTLATKSRFAPSWDGAAIAQGDYTTDLRRSVSKGGNRRPLIMCHSPRAQAHACRGEHRSSRHVCLSAAIPNNPLTFTHTA